MAENRTPQDLPDDLRLTQFGDQSTFGQGFRDRLREEIGETEISLILGEVDASAASMLVLKYLAPWAARRVTTAGALRAAGFRVVHSPTKTNRLHVSVYGPEQVEWDVDLAEKFNACFTEHESTEVTGHG